MRAVYRYLIVMVVVGAACAVALKFLPLPFFWVGLVLTGAAWFAAFRAATSLRIALVTIGSVAFAFALGEAFLSRAALYDDVVRRIEPPLNNKDPLLGWAPRASHVSHATARASDLVVYDVNYSIDAAGHRISPPDRGESVVGCLLFFADSFVFGEGVNDRETFPFQVGVMTLGRFRVVNLSAPAYGAEHMLAMAERGGLAAKLRCKPTHIFYTALPHHILRAAGKTSFSVNGPRYRLVAGGKAEYVGTNPTAGETAVEPEAPWREQLRYQLSKSRVVRVMSARPPATTEPDIELYFAIVREAFVLFKRTWPDAERHVISWDIDASFSNGLERFHRGLETVDAKVHLIDDILPGYSKDASKYSISRPDRHPNPAAYKLVASYLAGHVLGEQRANQ
jgi:hypothetical protein